MRLLARLVTQASHKSTVDDDVQYNTCCSGIFSLSTLFRSDTVDKVLVAVSAHSIRVDEVREARPRSALRPLILDFLCALEITSTHLQPPTLVLLIEKPKKFLR